MKLPVAVLALSLLSACLLHASEPLLLSKINWDFESGTLEGWTIVSGNLGKQPASNDNDRWKGNFNKHGKYFLGTFEDGAKAVGDKRKGIIRSPVFVVDADRLVMLIGGGRFATTYVALCDAADDRELLKVSGRNREAMREETIDVSPYKDKKVYLKVVDDAVKSWGHVNLDYVRAGTATTTPTPDTKTVETSPPEPVVNTPPQPIPDAALMPEAEFLVRDFFKAEFNKPGVTGQTALVKRLLREADETNTDMDLKYVLLREAYDAARAAGQFELAIAATRKMSTAFQVDQTKLKTDVFTKVKPTTPEGQRALLDCILHEIDASVASDGYAEALQFIGLASGLAERLKDTPIQARLKTQAKDLASRKVAFEKYVKAKETLEEKPDDAAAHLAIGTFLCFHKQAWKAGLPHLAQCAVPALKEAATLEMQEPQDAAGQADLADRWWSQSKRTTGGPKAAIQGHAVTWYIESLADVPAARQAVIQERLQSASGVSSATVTKLKKAGLVFYVNPGADPTGKARELLTFTAPTHVGTVTTVTVDGVKALKLPKSYATYPAGQAARTTTGSYFVWIKNTAPIVPLSSVIFRGTAPGPKTGKGVTDFTLFIERDRFRLYMNWPQNKWPGVDGKNVFYAKTPLPVGQWIHCGATWNGKHIALYLNGKLDRLFESTMTPVTREHPVKMILGCDPAGAPQYYPGVISCAMVFNRALTAAEVKQLHGMSALLGLVPR